MFDLKIAGGTVVDGTGAGRYRADIGIEDGAIVDVARRGLAYDLPAGGRRILQGATGYTATIVSGTVTRTDGVDTGARPGRLVRGTR